MKKLILLCSLLFVNLIQSQELKKIGKTEIEQHVILKGQLLDIESNQSIPFATLILKKEGIYRVADENGNYELPITKESMETTFVEISSIGYETTIISLDLLRGKIFLKPKFEELTEVVIKGYLSPSTVLKKAILKKKINHPVEPFNFKRYGKVIINKNDTTYLDLELITKDYDRGYLSPFVITQKVEEIKWNTNRYPDRYLYSSQFFSFRQNAIRYASILHKRKYKNFKLKFVKSDDPIDEGLYIISFQTEKNKWNYTNKSYPTNYSGRVYIDKESFAIIKVIENWESNLSKEEINEHFTKNDTYKNIDKTIIKEENVCYYSAILGDGKYYATNYFSRFINERITKNNKVERIVLDRKSYLYDFSTTEVEAIEYEFRKMEKTVLNRVAYDKNFWNSFYKREITENQDKKL